MKKIVLSLVLVCSCFLFVSDGSPRGSRRYDENYDKVQIIYKDKLLVLLTPKEYRKLVLDSFRYHKMYQAEKEGRVVFKIYKDGKGVIIWIDREGMVIRRFDFQLVPSEEKRQKQQGIEV